MTEKKKKPNKSKEAPTVAYVNIETKDFEKRNLKIKRGMFQSGLVELEKKYGLKLVPILDSSHNGIVPGIVIVDIKKHPEYASPKFNK